MPARPAADLSLDSDAAIARIAAQVGIRSLHVPSLEDVNRRKNQLWLTLSIVVVSALASVVLALTADTSGVPSPVLLSSVAAVLAFFGGYVVIKERSLRRLRGLLVGERVLTTALTDRLHEIEALLDASRAVNSGHELDTVLDVILGRAVDMLGGSGASVRRLVTTRDGEPELVVTATQGAVEAVGQSSQLGEGPAGRAARMREALLLTGRTAKSGERSEDSVMAIPMFNGPDLIGVLSVWAPPGRSLSEFDMRAAKVFAEHAAAAVSKADLLDAAKRDAQRLEHASLHDGLTGLGNRGQLTKCIDSALGRLAPGGPGVAVLFCDLDGFKTINDSLGHAAGDGLLTIFAERLRGVLRGDSMAARVGGDEFAVLIEGLRDPHTAGAVAERVIAAVEQPFTVGGRELRTSVSIGIALAGFDTSDRELDIDELLRRADIAMYAAKRSGGSAHSTFVPGQDDELAVPGARAAEPPAQIA